MYGVWPMQRAAAKITNFEKRSEKNSFFPSQWQSLNKIETKRNASMKCTAANILFVLFTNTYCILFNSYCAFFVASIWFPLIVTLPTQPSGSKHILFAFILSLDLEQLLLFALHWDLNHFNVMVDCNEDYNTLWNGNFFSTDNNANNNKIHDPI